MSFYRDFKDFILSYDYDLDKNFVISFPKTGRTWLRYMIKEMIRKSTNKLDVTFTHDHSEIIIEDGVRNDTKFIFDHIRRKRYKRARVIFLVRNPKDVVVSHYHHNKPAHRYEPGGQRQARVRLSVTQYRVRARTSNPRVWASSVRMRSVSSRRKLPVTRSVSRLGSQRNTPGR